MKYLHPADFTELEQALRITLPAYYKEFHLTATELARKVRQADPAPDDNSIALATDTEWLLETNALLGIPKHKGTARGKYCIGADGCGSYYLINLEDHQDTTVYQTPHDEYDYEEVFDPALDDFIWSHEGLIAAQNLTDFLQDIIQLRQELDDTSSDATA
jgi:hypothetical protein